MGSEYSSNGVVALIAPAELTIDTPRLSAAAHSRSRVWTVGGLFLVLLLIRVPFLLTHHIQEDAFITWRCAASWLKTGVYGFNPGERVSASTSHAYVLLSAGVMKIAGEHFIAVLLMLNAALFLVGMRLICVTIVNATANAEDRFWQGMWLWGLASILPVSLMTSYVGMETSLLMLLVGVAVAGLLGENRNGLITAAAFAALFLLPWTRPDAILLGGLLIAFAWWRSRRVPILSAVALMLGVGTTAAFNYLYFGAVLNQTIIAKNVAYHPSHSAASIILALKRVFLGTQSFSGMYGFYLPLNTHFLSIAAIPLLAAAWAISITFCIAAVRPPGGVQRSAVIFALLAFSLLLPLAYCVGGVLFPWYLWPAQIFANIVVLAAIIAWLQRRSAMIRRVGFSIILVSALVLIPGQASLALCMGTQEYNYRAEIGRYIGRTAPTRATLLLEPAGYIPFYSDRYTYDEVGLVTPSVTQYQRQFGDGWWMEFVKHYQPTYVIQRSDFIDNRVLYTGRTLTSDERAWFDAHYQLDREFHYDPADYWQNATIRRIVKLTTVTRYGVYRLRAEAPASQSY